MSGRALGAEGMEDGQQCVCGKQGDQCVSPVGVAGVKPREEGGQWGGSWFTFSQQQRQ